MTSYAVGYTTGGAEPEKDADGEEFVPEHAVPIEDGVAVTDPVPVIEDTEPEDGPGRHAGQDEDAEEDGAPKCAETTAAGEPCKNTAGDDGVCGVHRKKASDTGVQEDDGKDPANTDEDGYMVAEKVADPEPVVAEQHGAVFGDDSKLSK